MLRIDTHRSVHNIYISTTYDNNFLSFMGGIFMYKFLPNVLYFHLFTRKKNENTIHTNTHAHTQIIESCKVC